MMGVVFGSLAGVCAAGAAFAQGAGASVDWELSKENPAVIFYDAPANFDKHYRICFSQLPASGNLVVVMPDRSVTITNETCVDVLSYKISLMLKDSAETVGGIVYLVE